MIIPGFPGPYSENPGIPTEAERGVYCEHGEKIVEMWHSDHLGGMAYAIVEPWPCDRAGCTRERFEQAAEVMEHDLYESDPEGWIRDHTVDGIRPHIPRSQQSHAEREEVMRQLLVNWEQLDIDETGTIRGTE
jgi:hypothetical protein